MTPRQDPLPAPGQTDPRWVVDHGFLWLGATIWALGYTLPSLPPFGLSFRAQWLPLIMAAAWIMLRRFGLASMMLPQINLGMLLILAWIVMSAAWAPVPAYALTQSISIIGISLVALGFSLGSWRPDRFEKVLTVCTTTLLVASLFAGLLLPSVGVHASTTQFELIGSWKGITYQKNGLGQLASVGLILWTYRWAVGRTRPSFAVAGVALSLFLLVKSRSSTSLLLSTIACLVLILRIRPVIRFGGTGPLMAGTLIIALPLMAVTAIVVLEGSGMLAEAFGGLFGKDASFSGRTFIWAEVIQQIRLHPVIGTGFSSFWGDTLTRSAGAQTIVDLLRWDVPNAHNGYLDLLNELGAIGLAFFVLFLFVHMRDLVRLGRFDPHASALHGSILIYVMLANLSETGWFHPITMTHVLAMYSSVEVSRQLFERRLRGRVTSEPTAPPTFGRGAAEPADRHASP